MENTILDQNMNENTDFKPWNMDLKTFYMLMHLSQFASMIIPMGGIVLPIVMWQQFKDKDELIDLNGKKIINFMISFFIYMVSLIFLYIAGAIFFTIALDSSENVNLAPILALVLVFLWIIILLVLIFGHFACIIIAALKANKGEIPSYPLCIKFFKV